MRVLKLTAYGFPEQTAGGHIGGNLNDMLIQQGVDVVTYVPTPSRGISKEVRKQYRKKVHRNEVLSGGHQVIHRFLMFKEGKNPLLRALRYAFCAVKHFNRGAFAKDARSCDALFVYSTPPIQGAVAALVKHFNRIPIIYSLQDIFPDSLVGTGLAKKGGLLWKVGRIIENYTYCNADKIVVISEDFKKNIMAKGVPEDKIVVIYNWIDSQAVMPVSKDDNPLFEEFGISKERFTLVYAGNLGNAQNLSIILDAAPRLPDVQFMIFGTGGTEGVLRNRIGLEHLQNVKLLPLQPSERISQVYSLGDVCLVSCKAGLGGSAMPSKTWSIMSCARPVIAHFDEGELKDILEKNDCGLFSHAGNVAEFVDAIRHLAENPARCEEMGKNARQFILDNLSKEVGTKKYVDVIKSFEKK